MTSAELNVPALLQAALEHHRAARLPEARALYERVLRKQPRNADALNLLGGLLAAQGDAEAGARLIRQAIAYRPDFPEALSNLGIVLKNLGRAEEARVVLERALALRPAYPEALNNLANVLRVLCFPEQALTSFDRALALVPASPQALAGRAHALLDLRRHQEALAGFDRLLALKPDDADALDRSGEILLRLQHPAAASARYARLRERDPGYPLLAGQLQLARMQACDWADHAARLRQVTAAVQAGQPAAHPFAFHGMSDCPKDLYTCAATFMAARHPPLPAIVSSGVHDGGRIRIGYVSGEFRHQATSILLTGLLEHHDRDRFEIFAVDAAGGDGSDLRRRIEAGVHEIIDISALDDGQAAEAVGARRIDILLNLNLFFGRARNGLFARRPSPVQVSWLGFPGTSGASYMDYLLADRFVVRPEDEAWFSERVVYLPDSYQPNDRSRRIAETVPTRAELGLPDDGFVFCCFNNNYKITPAMFDIWMRLLAGIDGSVLWLLADNADAARNLRHEAERRGVAAERLVFAPRTDLPQHLARHRAADLFLDTLPYNAHTTGSDALWAGLPLLTCRGGAFASRVASSLLHAVGLAELVTHTLAEYEALALQLARDGKRLGTLRARLADNRTTHPLFDADRFRRHVEVAYVAMWQRHRSGQPPAGFTVPPHGGRVPYSGQ